MSERSSCSKRKRKREREEKEAALLRSVPSIQTFFKRSEEHHQEEDDTVEEEVSLQANAEVEEDEPVASCSHSTGDSQPDIPSTSYQDEIQRVKRRKSLPDESTEHEVTLKGRNQYRIETFNVIIDKLGSCLAHRTERETELRRRDRAEEERQS